MAKVLFKSGTLAQYNALSTKDASTLYFITDAHKIYKGDVDYTDSVIVGTIPSTGIQGKLYIDSTTGEAKIYVGSAWKTVNPGYTNSFADIVSNKNGTRNKLVTGEAVYDLYDTFITRLETIEGDFHDHAALNASTTEKGHVSVDGTTITANDDGKISVGNIAESQVTNLTTDLNAKAPKASPTFTGTVTLPAADPTADTQAAHKKYVDSVGSTTLSSAKTYAEGQATTALNSAKTYADGVGTSTLNSAKSYADTQDAATLASAKSYADSILGANDAMLFKGTIGTGGTVTALPATHETGWTYKVITAGTYAGQKCEIGDMIICVTDGSAANDADWTVIQNNIDGAVTGPTSSTDAHVATFNGTTGKVIKDSGFTIGKSVPADAKFTDTTYSLDIFDDGESLGFKIVDNNSNESKVSISGRGGIDIYETYENGYRGWAFSSSAVTSISAQNTDNGANLTIGYPNDSSEVILLESDDATTPSISISADSVDNKIQFAINKVTADKVSAMTGYTKASTASAITASDTLNSALGKLEKALDGKAATVHTHTTADTTALTGYTTSGITAGALSASLTLNQALAKLDVSKAPKASPTFTGTVTLPAADPTADTQAAHKKYVDSVGTSTLSSAKTYAEGQATTALNSAKSYADTQDGVTLNSAKTYAEGQATTALNSAKSYADTQDGVTLESAKSYIDAALTWQAI